MDGEFHDDPLDRPVYGAANIARVVGLSINQTYLALEKRYLDADKFGRRWVSTPRRLKRVATVSPDWRPRKSNEPLDAA
jgi:hypothetical protein